MIEEIYELGEILTSMGKSDIVDVFLDKAKLRNTKIVLCIAFEINQDRLAYKEVNIEKYDPNKIHKYLYKGGSSRGTDVMPTALVAKDLEKTFENKILKWFEKIEVENDFIKNIKANLENNKSEISRELLEKYNTLSKEEKQNVLLTLKFISDGDIEKYIGDFEVFREILVESSKEKYFFLSSMGTSKGWGTCYLCGENKEVYGFVLPAFGFSFSTADKPGFIGGLSKTDRWKEIPICESCAMKLELGKKFLDEFLSFRFYSNRYYVIPQIVLPEKREEILRYFISRVDDYHGKEYHEGLIVEEDYVPEVVAEQGNVMKLIFVFYKTKGGGKYIDILKYVENVLPTTLKNIYEVEREIRMDNYYDETLVKNIFGKKEDGNFVNFNLRKTKSGGSRNWYLSFGRRFFKSDKEFLDYVAHILNERPLNKGFLMTHFVDAIQEEFRKNNDYNFKLRVIESMMLYDFLKGMNLLGGENVDEVKEYIKPKFSTEAVEKFFEERKGTFKTPQSRAAFLVGALVNNVLSVQRNERGVGYGDEPFRAKLYGLALDEKKLRKIFTAAVEKLAEYKRSSPIESVAAEYLSLAGNNWSMSKDEISYYFALGMVIGSFPFWIKENKKEVSENGDKE